MAKDILDEFGSGDILDEFNIGYTNIMPQAMVESAAWQTQTPVNRMLDAVSSVIKRPHQKAQKDAEKLAQQNTRDVDPLMQSIIEGRKNQAEAIAPFAAPILGYGQSMLNAPISLANLGLEQTNLGTIPYADVSQTLPDNMLAQGSFLGGQIGGYMQPYNILSKTANMARPGGVAGLLYDALAGAGIGYGLGGEGGDVGRAISGVLGGVFTPITSLSAKKIADRVSARSKKLLTSFNKRYDRIIEGSQKAGASLSGKIPNIEWAPLKAFTQSKWGKSVPRFLKDPSIKNAHELQSDLGKFINNLEKRQASTGLSSTELQELNLAKDAQKRMRGSLFQELEATEKGLGKQYQSVTNDYADEMVPYLNKNIKKYQKGEGKTKKKMTPERLVKKLSSNEDLEAGVLPDFPEAKVRKAIIKMLPALAKYGLLGGGLIYGGGVLKDIFSGHEE